MFIKKLLLLLTISFFSKISIAQTSCTALGQNPATALPVCGTSVFSQTTVPVCGGRTVPSKCIGVLFVDKNPYWYKFTCFATGTLGFVITPSAPIEDYDWQLFDVTNHDPNDIYTDASLFVACDWSGDTGPTGTSANGTSLVRCDGPGIPLFTLRPQIIQGHNYLLLISHFSDTQSGYSLSFGGGTGVITDSTTPHLQSVAASCDGQKAFIKLNKKMKCSSLAADGSDFSIAPAVATITSSTSAQCSSGFDMDSIVLTFSNPLPTGNYTISIKNGDDGNTLLDNCDNTIAGESLPLIVNAVLPTSMDSLTTVGCAPGSLQLVFKRPILCNSIAPDGSDFIITGTPSVSITGAAGNCINGSTTIINVQLAAPIQQKGSYQIQLVTGKDGNTIINECGLQTPAGSSLSFSTKDTVSAAFALVIKFSCKIDTVIYSHDGRNGVNSWQWDFAEKGKSTSQNNIISYSSFGQKNATLIVSNGVCSDTATNTVLLDNQLKAAFEGANIACPGDQAIFKDNSIGHIVSWNWSFGNGNASTLQTPPPQTYFSAGVIEVPVNLTIQDDIGCKDSATHYIKVVDNCYIAVPSAFTPNNDGLNDYLYPLNAYKAVNLVFKIFNRFGQQVFETNDWTNKWDGTFKGQPASAGAYVWLLQYTDSETGKKYFSKGTSILIR